ncbi:MAG: type II toxin-antitoxin system VapC family toxin [Chloroflexota bacterium]|nr:MAG: type II toxin-antitoxin system VapC family toxin [Chloroflexota bacterium]
MRLLLDTNALLWCLYQPDRLTADVRDAITDPNNDVYVSIVSGWEIAIKVSSGRLHAPRDVATWLPSALFVHRFTSRSVELRHVLAVEHLPRHHGDPFDRLLIAEAIADGLTIVTSDRVFAAYPVPIVRCW